MKSPVRSIRSVLDWYFDRVYGKVEGPGVLPFYCDPLRVGHFAVSRTDLAAGGERALFRLLIGQAMFQARRDVLIMQQQRMMNRTDVDSLVAPDALTRSIRRSRCATLDSAQQFDRLCSVRKAADVVDCAHHPGATCHVKHATTLFNRMSDMGKLPTSAWLHLANDGHLVDPLSEIASKTDDPLERARLLVGRFARVHRIGRKLSTMFVSALSTPALAPGFTPWFPAVDGNDLVVVDTNVARAATVLEAPSASYDTVTRWVRGVARRIDLRVYRRSLPRYSPRVVQQALYVYCSKSNRVAHNDACAVLGKPCGRCVMRLCPFTSRASVAK
jgi:hypothetical protein